MRPDPIVEEIRKYRKTHAKKFNYNIEAIVADLRRQESDMNEKKKSLHPNRRKTKIK